MHDTSSVDTSAQMRGFLSILLPPPPKGVQVAVIIDGWLASCASKSGADEKFLFLGSRRDI